MKKILYSSLFMGMLAMSSCCSPCKKNEAKAAVQDTLSAANDNVDNKKGQPIEMNEAMFKEKIMDFDSNPDNWQFKGDKPVIIDFYATWCGPCKLVAPILDSISSSYAGKIDVYKVDVDKNESLSRYFNITSIPTLLFIPKSGEPTTNIGLMSKEEIEDMIKDKLMK